MRIRLRVLSRRSPPGAGPRLGAPDGGFMIGVRVLGGGPDTAVRSEPILLQAGRDRGVAPDEGLPAGHYAVARIFCRSSSTIMAPEGPRPRNQTSSSTGRACPFCTAFSRLHSSPFTTGP